MATPTSECQEGLTSSRGVLMSKTPLYCELPCPGVDLSLWLHLVQSPSWPRLVAAAWDAQADRTPLPCETSVTFFAMIVLD